MLRFINLIGILVFAQRPWNLQFSLIGLLISVSRSFFKISLVGL